MRLRYLVPITTIATLAVPATASAMFLHTVLPGESLSSIAVADGLTLDQLAAANGLATDVQLVTGSTVAIPAQGAPAATPTLGSAGNTSAVAGDGDGDSDDSVSLPTTAAPTAETAAPSQPTAAPSTAVGDGDADGDDPVSSTGNAPSAGTTTAGSYVVQPGDTLTAIAARGGTAVSELAAANGIDPTGVLIAGRVLVLPQPGTSTPAPVQAPAVGATIVGRMTWFGGPNDPGAQGVPASGLGWRKDGMAYYSYGSLGRHWLIHFPWGETVPMTQIDVGPAPWTGNPFDIAFSALPHTPYSEQTWPNPTVTGTYQGP